jgi:predicted MFS family arabinose efflux permease
VFLSAVQIAILPQQKSSNFPSELKVAAQEQVLLRRLLEGLVSTGFEACYTYS